LAKIHSKRDINKTQNPKKLKSIGKVDKNIDFLVNGKREAVIKAPITQNPPERRKLGHI
jgi:hypothetical protein